jgi:hypothetical protein
MIYTHTHTHTNKYTSGRLSKTNNTTNIPTTHTIRSFVDDECLFGTFDQIESVAGMMA